MISLDQCYGELRAEIPTGTFKASVLEGLGGAAPPGPPGYMESARGQENGESVVVYGGLSWQSSGISGAHIDPMVQNFPSTGWSDIASP